MWPLSFISEVDFTQHVESTIQKYSEKDGFDLKKFNNNIIDPIKLIFDKTVYDFSWEEIFINEIFRQRDKSNNNDIGYFHQNLFSYISGCEVPADGWDVIYKSPTGIQLSDGKIIHKIYVEIKNKHNTMNSSSSAKTYMKMQSQILDDDDCACFLVEVIARNSQNIKWSATVDKKKLAHNLIRRVSIDKFYEIVTGEPDAFYKICMVLPDVIDTVVSSSQVPNVPIDSAYAEVCDIAQSKQISFVMALYLLGFNLYDGFKKL